MRERALLGRAKVVHDSPGRNRSRMMIFQPHAIQRVHAQLLAKQGKGIVLGEGPVFNLGARARDVQLRGLFFRFANSFLQHALANTLRGGTEPCTAASEQDFGGTHAGQLVQRQRPRRGPGELSGAELAGGEIKRRGPHGRSRAVAGSRDAREPLAFARVERGVDRCPRGEDARDLAADDGLRGLGILHLLAQRDAIALAQQALQVGAGGVVGDPAHGYGFGLVARGEGELQLARGDQRVLVEELVEVAEAEEQQRVGMRVLGGAILPHDWREVAFRGRGEVFGGKVHALVSETPRIS